MPKGSYEHVSTGAQTDVKSKKCICKYCGDEFMARAVTVTVCENELCQELREKIAARSNNRRKKKRYHGKEVKM